MKRDKEFYHLSLSRSTSSTWIGAPYMIHAIHAAAGASNATDPASPAPNVKSMGSNVFSNDLSDGWRGWPFAVRFKAHCSRRHRLRPGQYQKPNDPQWERGAGSSSPSSNLWTRRSCGILNAMVRMWPESMICLGVILECLSIVAVSVTLITGVG